MLRGPPDLKALAQVPSFGFWGVGRGQCWCGESFAQSLFMNNSSYLGRWGGLGWVGRKPATPDSHNNNLLASHMACCCVHHCILCVTESSPAPRNQVIVPNP